MGYTAGTLAPVADAVDGVIGDLSQYVNCRSQRTHQFTGGFKVSRRVPYRAHCPSLIGQTF
jgi:hypothetical protein